jgi:hypothetical protein
MTRRTLSLTAVTVLAMAGLVGPTVRPALAVDLCAGTGAVQATPGIHLTQVRSIHVTQLGSQAGSLVCTVAPLLGTLLVETVDVHVSGTCIATSLDSTPGSTMVFRFPDESNDSTADITSFVLNGTSASKIITFNGRVRAGDPHGNQNAQLVITSAGPTTDCNTDAGLTEFSGVATFLFD